MKSMDELVFFANEYIEEDWKAYAKCFNNVNITIDGIPQDIVNAVLTVLGSATGLNWLKSPLSAFNGQTVSELVLTENGEKAIKAYIMRLPN